MTQSLSLYLTLDYNAVQKVAETKKEWGNKLYESKDYVGALAMFDETIELCPRNAVYHGNRSACHFMLGMYKKAFDDAQKAVSLDPKYSKGYIRMAKCCIKLGDLTKGDDAVKRASELGETDNVQLEMELLKTLRDLHDKAQVAIQEKNYAEVINCMNTCLEHSPSSIEAKLMKAEYLAKVGQCNEAWKLVCTEIPFINSDSTATYVRGLCLYYLGKYEEALKHFQLVLRFSPNHAKALETQRKASLLKEKIDEGIKEYKLGRWQSALSLFNEALSVEEDNIIIAISQVYFYKATVCTKLNLIYEAATACKKGFDLLDNPVNAHVTLSKSYRELGEYQEAYKVSEILYGMDENKENKQLLEELEKSFKEDLLREKNFYQILGIKTYALADDVRAAYWKLAALHHPDKHVNAPRAERQEQERRFKRITEAYSVLSDPGERAKYDIKFNIKKSPFNLSFTPKPKKLAALHHPDKHVNAPRAERQEQERRFKRITEAYSVLSDPGERAKYDIKFNIKKSPFNLSFTPKPKKLAALHHPDKHVNAPRAERQEQERRFKRITEAYSVLSDPGERAKYDIKFYIKKSPFNLSFTPKPK